MKRSIELLAPGGDIDSIKAAIIAGADAVYCGLGKFNARNRATNIGFDDLNGILHLAHKHNCQVFLTLNIIIVESEIPNLFSILNKLVNTSIDGIIIQDLGLFYIVSKYFKNLKIHASTQLTTHNKGQIEFLSKLATTRVNLSRELNIYEITSLTTIAHENNMLVEVFVHGSYCICFSGICYMSSVHGGNSGNRGRCSQPCRDQYITTQMGKNFPLNLKDNSAYSNLPELFHAGVDSLKIEGRIKKFHFVYTVVHAWRMQLQSFYNTNKLLNNKQELYQVFNRDFSNGFLNGTIAAEMFIDNPRDHSAIHLSETIGGCSHENIEKAKGDIYNQRTGIISYVENQINQLNASKAALNIRFSGESGKPLMVTVQTPDALFELYSEMNLAIVEERVLDIQTILSRFKALNDTEYFINKIDLSNLQPNVFIPFNELTAIKNKLRNILNNSREFIEPIVVPSINKPDKTITKPQLSVLISTESDIYLCKETAATLYFQLPNSLKHNCLEYINLFKTHKELIPCFPSILIGADYFAALEFLRQVQPLQIVTNNTGIAFEAYNLGIKWIAGPHLNIVNSFSLICLKESFNCAGAFISNELSRSQIKSIKKPENFQLYYSIYHPLVLMTTRQCLFHQVTGCERKSIDDSCIEHCSKSTSITNLKNTTFIINKSKNNLHTIYNETNFLNTDIMNDIPDMFSGFHIDLTNIKTNTQVNIDIPAIINLFENLLNGNSTVIHEIHRAIHLTTNAQYNIGI
jgi:putative protease